MNTDRKVIGLLALGNRTILRNARFADVVVEVEPGAEVLLVGCQFRNCDLSQVEPSRLVSCTFENCDLPGVLTG